jgi:glycerol-3-phosphate dehydrogenase
MSIARTAAAFGAFIATRTKVISLLRDGKKVTGARVEDLLTGHEFDVRAKTVILAAGVWSDEIHTQLGVTPGYSVRMSKGVHIVMPKGAISSSTGIIIKTAVSVLFIIPWGEQWLVGTTDTEYKNEDKNAVASEEDVEYILNQANRVLNPPLNRQDVIGVFAGLRPLISSNAKSSTTKLSREHIVDHPLPGFVSIAGGKYTTYRVMAEDAVNVAVRDLRKIVPASVTQDLPILGAYGYAALNNQRDLLSMEMEIDREIIDHLMDRYGSLIEDIFEIIDHNAHMGLRVVPHLNYIWAEISYAITHEGAFKLDDILSRRTRLAFELPHAAKEIVDEVADHVAPLLGWNAKSKKVAVEEYLTIASRELGEVTQ